MKTSKKLLLFITGLTILGMIVLFSCNNRYTGPNKEKGIFSENDLIIPAGYLTQEEQYRPLDPDSKAVVLFTNNDYRIPALTITAKKTILAAVGTKESLNHIAIKRSSDMGQTWTEVQASYSDFNNMYTHPFFINAHDGSILLGISTTNKDKNETVIYKSVNDGNSWTKLGTNLIMSNLTPTTNTEKNGKKTELTPDNSFVTYGNGVTLRHGNNRNTLIFPFYYQQKTGSPQGHCTATMISTDNGNTWKQLGIDLGVFTTFETKFIELANGNILINMLAQNGQTYWGLSTDCGETWALKTLLATETKEGVKDANSGKHVDFTRYEFNGKDIKNGRGAQYALMVLSKKNANRYNVRMTLNDFNEGAGNFNSKYTYNKDFGTNTASDGGYPAITVLPDGTIATLTEETNNIVFRRFNLSWLSSNNGTEDGEEYVDYEIDNILK